MNKTNYYVARVVTHTRNNISKFERHNERKNKTYSNMNISPAQTPNNVYYKRCETTLNEKLKEMVDSGLISLRGLKDNAKVYDEIVFDINSDYSEQNGGYDFAKEFYEKAFHFAEKEMGAENILSAVMHADELNVALTEQYGKPIFHYHLHVIAIPTVKKEIKWSKRCKDKSLVGTTKEIINQVSHSKKWKSQKATDNLENPLYDKNGKPILIKSYSLLQDRFFEYMSDCGYRGFIRGVKGSTIEHLDNLDYKIKKENERYENLKQEIETKQTEIDTKQAEITALDVKLDEYVNYESTIKEFEDFGKQKRFSKKVEIEKDKFDTLINFAKKGISADRIIKNLEEKVNILTDAVYAWKQKYTELKDKTKDFIEALKISPKSVTEFIKDILFKEQERLKKLKEKQFNKLYGIPSSPPIQKNNQNKENSNKWKAGRHAR